MLSHSSPSIPSSSPPTDVSYQTLPIEQVTALVLVLEEVQLLSSMVSEDKIIQVPLPHAQTPNCLVSGQQCWTTRKAEHSEGAGASGSSSNDPLAYMADNKRNCTCRELFCLVDQMETGGLKLPNTRVNQHLVLHLMGSTMYDLAILLQALVGMAGSPFRLVSGMEFHLGDLVMEMCQRAQDFQEMDHTEEEVEHGSHGDSD